MLNGGVDVDFSPDADLSLIFIVLIVKQIWFAKKIMIFYVSHTLNLKC